MKRKIILSTFLIFTVLFLGLFFQSTSQSKAPRFVPASTGFKVGAYTRINYNFLLPSPFEGGLVWIEVYDKTKSHHTYLYDLERKKVLGQLQNGWPVFGNHDQSKVLLSGPSHSLKEGAFELLDRLTGGKLNLFRSNREESFAMFDRTRNDSAGLGKVYQAQGAGSRWYPSPTFRYGFTIPTANSDNDIFVIDMEKAGMTKSSIHRHAFGWWNDTTILCKSENNDLALYDVEKEQTSILLKSDEIKAFFKTNQISTLSGSALNPFPMWDGHQYQFYFTDTHKRWEATNSFLAKLERPSGQLKLIAADFKFEWSDSFDPSGRYYLFSGRDSSSREKIGAVYVRDLNTETTRTLVEDCGEKQFSIPHWYGNGVIYSRSNMLWRIELSETNSSRLFPPPGE